MGGGDLITVGRNIVMTFGGQAGGYILLAAATIVGLLCLVHLVPARLLWHTLGIGIVVWVLAFIVRTLTGWSV